MKIVSLNLANVGTGGEPPSSTLHGAVSAPSAAQSNFETVLGNSSPTTSEPSAVQKQTDASVPSSAGSSAPAPSGRPGKTAASSASPAKEKSGPTQDATAAVVDEESGKKPKRVGARRSLTEATANLDLSAMGQAAPLPPSLPNVPNTSKGSVSADKLGALASVGAESAPAASVLTGSSAGNSAVNVSSGFYRSPILGNGVVGFNIASTPSDGAQILNASGSPNVGSEGALEGERASESGSQNGILAKVPVNGAGQSAKGQESSSESGSQNGTLAKIVVNAAGQSAKGQEGSSESGLPNGTFAKVGVNAAGQLPKGQEGWIGSAFEAVVEAGTTMPTTAPEIVPPAPIIVPASQQLEQEAEGMLTGERTPSGAAPARGDAAKAGPGVFLNGGASMSQIELPTTAVSMTAPAGEMAPGILKSPPPTPVTTGLAGLRPRGRHEVRKEGSVISALQTRIVLQSEAGGGLVFPRNATVAMRPSAMEQKSGGPGDAAAGLVLGTEQIGAPAVSTNGSTGSMNLALPATEEAGNSTPNAASSVEVVLAPSQLPPEAESSPAGPASLAAERLVQADSAKGNQDSAPKEPAALKQTGAAPEAASRTGSAGKINPGIVSQPARPVTTELAASRGRGRQELTKDSAVNPRLTLPGVSQPGGVSGFVRSGDVAATARFSAAAETSAPPAEFAVGVGSGRGVFFRGRSSSPTGAPAQPDKSQNSGVSNLEGGAKPGNGVLLPGGLGSHERNNVHQTLVANPPAHNEAPETAVVSAVGDLVVPMAKETFPTSAQDNQVSDRPRAESQTIKSAQPDGTSLGSSDSEQNGTEAHDPALPAPGERAGRDEFTTKVVNRAEANRLTSGTDANKVVATARRVDGPNGLSAGGSADAGGTLDAKQASTMAVSAKNETGRSDFGKNIPRVGRNDSLFSVAEQNPALLDSRAARADIFGGERLPAAFSVNGSAGIEGLKIAEHGSLSSVDGMSSRSIRLAENVWSAVESFRATSVKDWEVRIRPDAETQLNLKLTVQNNQLLVHAKLESGSWETMAPRWNELQVLLADRGVQLRPLEMSVAPGWNGQQSGQSGFGGNDQRQSAFESARREEFVETGARFSEEPAKQRKTASGTSPTSGAVWETWA